MRSPLLEQLVTKHGFTLVDEDNLDTFVKQHEYCMLFFSNEPKQYPESNDVAVIAPELMKAFGDNIGCALVDASLEQQLSQFYGFKVWPTLVFLKQNQYLGAVSRVQNWGEYLQRINDILKSAPSRPPSIGVPVVSA